MVGPKASQFNFGFRLILQIEYEKWIFAWGCASYMHSKMFHEYMERSDECSPTLGEVQDDNFHLLRYLMLQHPLEKTLLPEKSRFRQPRKDISLFFHNFRDSFTATKFTNTSYFSSPKGDQPLTLNRTRIKI